MSFCINIEYLLLWRSKYPKASFDCSIHLKAMFTNLQLHYTNEREKKAFPWFRSKPLSLPSKPVSGRQIKSDLISLQDNMFFDNPLESGHFLSNTYVMWAMVHACRAFGILAWWVSDPWWTSSIWWVGMFCKLRQDWSRKGSIIYFTVGPSWNQGQNEKCGLGD